MTKELTEEQTRYWTARAEQESARGLPVSRDNPLFKRTPVAHPAQIQTEGPDSEGRAFRIVFGAICVLGPILLVGLLVLQVATALGWVK